jgi:tRNA-dihydrouridine synthase B
MAGVTDRPFRMLCKKLGAGYAVRRWSPPIPRSIAPDKSRRRIDHAGEPRRSRVQIAAPILR